MSFSDFFIYIGPSLIVASFVISVYIVCRMIQLRNSNYDENDQLGTEEIEIVIKDNDNQNEVVSTNSK